MIWAPSALLFLSLLSSSNAFSPLDWRSTGSSSPFIRRHRKTQYPINDDICAPTEDAELEKVVQRHCRTLDLFLGKRPIAAHTKAAFEAAKEQLKNLPSSTTPRHFILDSGCGTGCSTLLLGQRFPEHIVVGVDRSFTRLSRNPLDNEFKDSEESNRPFQALTSNVMLVRADLTDFWRCCIEDGWHVDRHYILYPNPYPKKKRLKKRFYAHPSFPLILGLGGCITVRSNWEGYLKEFSQSVVHANNYYKEFDGQKNHAKQYLECALRGPYERTDKSVAWTRFEKKYDEVGESTYELVLRCSNEEAF